MTTKTHRGKLTTWKDDKGFGFITPNGGEKGEKDVFIHISALNNPTRRPRVGDIIIYELRMKENGQLNANNAVIEGLKPKGRPEEEMITENPLHPLQKLLIIIPFLLSGYLLFKTHNPIPLLLYMGLSAMAFLAYFVDKAKAVTNQWRMSELTLHLLELGGGWPGALLAQHQARHKTKKPSYQIIFWTIVIIHFILWISYFAITLISAHH